MSTHAVAAASFPPCTASPGAAASWTGPISALATDHLVLDAINPDLQRFMAKRMGATTIEVRASHLSLISHPQEITNLILQAAGRG
jgi:hypothetical protein